MSDNPMSVGHPGEGVPFHVCTRCACDSKDGPDDVTCVFHRNNLFWFVSRGLVWGAYSTITRAPERGPLVRGQKGPFRAPENDVNRAPFRAPLAYSLGRILRGRALSFQIFSQLIF